MLSLGPLSSQREAEFWLFKKLVCQMFLWGRVEGAQNMHKQTQTTLFLIETAQYQQTDEMTLDRFW